MEELCRLQTALIAALHHEFGLDCTRCSSAHVPSEPLIQHLWLRQYGLWLRLKHRADEEWQSLQQLPVRKWQSSRCRFQIAEMESGVRPRVGHLFAVDASPQRPFSFTLRNERRPLMQTSTKAVLSIARKNKHRSKQLPYFLPCCPIDRKTTRKNAPFSSVRTKMFFLSFKMEEHKVPLQHPPEPWLFRDVMSC